MSAVAAQKEVGWSLPPGLDGVAVGVDALLDAADRDPEFVIDGIAEGEDLILLTGREKDAYKTTLLADLAIARVLGAQWLGRAVKSGGMARVLLISPETQARHLARRVSMLVRGRGADARRVGERIQIIPVPVSMVPSSDRQRAYEKARVATKLAAVKSFDPDTKRSLHKGVQAVSEAASDSLGTNLDLLAAIEGAPQGTWSLIGVDTLRSTFEGDENSSKDARAYMQACRDLARSAGCPVVVVHHTNKTGDGGDARSSRGSVEITAAPDALLSIDTSGDHPTMHFRLRNHESPEPIGYRLVAVAPDDLDADAMEPEERARLPFRFHVLDAAAPTPKGRRAAGKGLDDAEVLAVLTAHAPSALSESKIRTLVSETRNGSKGSKYNAGAVRTCLDRLVAQRLASATTIRPKSGAPFAGWRAGKDATPDVGKTVSSSAGNEVFAVVGDGTEVVR